jgi:hypothetical protein
VARTALAARRLAANFPERLDGPVELVDLGLGRGPLVSEHPEYLT